MRNNDNDEFFMASVFCVLFLLASCLLTAGGAFKTDPATARRVLQDEGYENIELTDYQYFSCGRGDTTNTGFTATRSLSNGTVRHVQGVVCCGYLKDCTIRH